MKAFVYEFSLSEPGRCDVRSGVVVANTESEAKGLLLDNYPRYMYSKEQTTGRNVEVREIDLSQTSIDELAFDGYEE